MNQQAFEQWKEQYGTMKDRAERITLMILNSARQATKEAGLDPSLLGIHPHNAMCSFKQGKPWPEVNYSKCRLALRLIEKSYQPNSIVDQWSKRVWKERVEKRNIKIK